MSESIEKRLIKIAKNASLNMLWVAMFLPLWPLEDHFSFRLSACFFMALTLAIFQVLFKEH